MVGWVNCLIIFLIISDIVLNIALYIKSPKKTIPGLEEGISLIDLERGISLLGGDMHIVKSDMQEIRDEYKKSADLYERRIRKLEFEIDKRKKLGRPKRKKD